MFDTRYGECFSYNNNTVLRWSVVGDAEQKVDKELVSKLMMGQDVTVSEIDSQGKGRSSVLLLALYYLTISTFRSSAELK